MDRKLKFIVLILCLIALSCGGGGGGGAASGSAIVAPETISCVSGNGQIRISWGKVSDATKYNIYWSTATGVSKKTGTKISPVSSPYYHTGLTNYTPYYYVITSENDYGESSESKEVSATPSNYNPLLPPKDISAQAGHMNVTIRWTPAESENAYTLYNIYWSTSSGVAKASGNKIENALSPYIHTGLTNGTVYYYVVTGVNQFGEGIESEEVSAIPNQGDAPSPPTGVSAVSGDRQAVISWTAVENATNYNIYWSTSPDLSSANGTKFANVTSPYTHSRPTQGKTNYYVVTAVNGYGESSGSEQTSVMTPDSRVDMGVAMGDSITAGYVGLANHDDCYVSVLSRLWGKSIQNEGVNGASTNYGLSIIDNILDARNPKYLTIFYGTIDISYYSIDTIIGNLRTIISKAKGNGTIPVVATVTPDCGEWLWRDKAIAQLNQRIRQLASEQEIACADLEAAFSWNCGYITSDGLHPNEVGHQIIANTFNNVLPH